MRKNAGQRAGFQPSGGHSGPELLDRRHVVRPARRIWSRQPPQCAACHDAALTHGPSTTGGFANMHPRTTTLDSAGRVERKSNR
jgi:hypothetical protein